VSTVLFIQKDVFWSLHRFVRRQPTTNARTKNANTNVTWLDQSWLPMFFSFMRKIHHVDVVTLHSFVALRERRLSWCRTMVPDLRYRSPRTRNMWDVDNDDGPNYLRFGLLLRGEIDTS